MALFRQGALLINRQGRRFTDENAEPALAVSRQPGGDAYIVFDDRIARTFTSWPHFISTAPGVAYAYLPDYRRSRPDIYHQHPDLAGLAASMGVPPAELKNAVEGQGTLGGRTSASLSEAPFYALGPLRSYVVFSEGGLRVTEQHEVLRRDGSVIPGLFAVGAVGQGGLLLEGHGHHLDWAFISGRRAGRNAALRVEAV
jgi:fumarate reductase flavoprotein subunit